MNVDIVMTRKTDTVILTNLKTFQGLIASQFISGTILSTESDWTSCYIGWKQVWHPSGRGPEERVLTVHLHSFDSRRLHYCHVVLV